MNQGLAQLGPGTGPNLDQGREPRICNHVSLWSVLLDAVTEQPGSKPDRTSFPVSLSLSLHLRKT